jgi:hypothetical protein
LNEVREEKQTVNFVSTLEEKPFPRSGMNLHTRNQMTDDGRQNETRGRKSEVGGQQMPVINKQSPVIGDQKTEGSWILDTGF